MLYSAITLLRMQADSEQTASIGMPLLLLRRNAKPLTRSRWTWFRFSPSAVPAT